jgi:hypothetical protein
VLSKGRLFGILGALAMTASAPLAGSSAALAQGFQPLSHVTIGQAAPDFTLMGSDGRQHKLSDYRGKVVVLEWTSSACPFTAAKYKSGQIQDTQKAAARQHVVWLSINTSHPGQPGYLTPAQAKARIGQIGAKVTAFLLDDGKTGRAYGAKDTPAGYVIGRTGQVLYQGAFDDDDMARGEIHHNYVTEALDDIAAGHPVAVPQTRQYGCPVEY